MADMSSRIDQYRKMASDDPNNELGHFSLGRAYLDAGMDAHLAKPIRAAELKAFLARFGASSAPTVVPGPALPARAACGGSGFGGATPLP